MVVWDDGQRAQGIRLESIDGAFAGFPMQPLVGDFREPLPSLSIHVVQVSELAQRPEALARVSDGALHFPFFPTRRHITSFWIKAVFAGESEKAREETDQTA